MRGESLLVLVLGLVVRRGGAGGKVNGRGDVGAGAVVEGVSVDVAGIVMTAATGIVGVVVGGAVEVLAWRRASEGGGGGCMLLPLPVAVAALLV